MLLRRISAAGVCAILACTNAEGTSRPPEPTSAMPAQSRPVTPPPADPSPPEPAAATQIEDISPAIASVLADMSLHYRRADTRIAVGRRGKVRLRPDGPAQGLADLAPFPTAQRLIVVDDAERPRVVVDDDVRLLLHVERDDATPVIVAPAPLRRSAGTRLPDPPRRGHVLLRPGAWVKVLAESGEDVKVVYDEEGVRFSGWVRADAIGTTATRRRRETADFDLVSTARRSTPLLRAPGGPRLARVERDSAVLALRPRPTEGHVLVEYLPNCVDEYGFVGFVAERDLYNPNYGSSYGCGYVDGPPLPKSWGDAESAPRVRVDAGRFLLDADGPTIVGCVVRATELASLDDHRFAVPTIWGPITVRLAPEGFGGACGTER